jgi:hypothetical protein
MPLVSKTATPQQRSWCVLQLAKKLCATALCISHTISHGTTQPGIICLCLLQEISRKGAFAKARLLVSPLCVMPTSILIAKFSFGKWLYKIQNDRDSPHLIAGQTGSGIIKYEIFMVTKCNEV